MDRPIDLLVDQGVEVFELAFVDGAVERALKTPEAVLCHDSDFPELNLRSANGCNARHWRRRGPDAAQIISSLKYWHLPGTQSAILHCTDADRPPRIYR
jgi:hypothetical protein